MTRQTHKTSGQYDTVRAPKRGTSSANAEGGLLTLRQACSREKPESAMCVQNFDDSRGFAIRITYRISLRSSSLWEPRHPLLKVVDVFSRTQGELGRVHERKNVRTVPRAHSHDFRFMVIGSRPVSLNGLGEDTFGLASRQTKSRTSSFTRKKILDRCGNDPSAGSPTETLLRLHLPLDDKV